MEDTVTLHDMLTEMQSFVTVDEETLKKAESSDINNQNNKELHDLIGDWVEGIYDNDPEVLKQNLIDLIP